MFSLINTWASGDLFTSAQANNIATTLVKALDKSISGDTLSGVVTIASTGSLVANLPNGFVVNGMGGFAAPPAGAVQATQPGAIQSTTAGGISPGVAGGISDGGIAGGIVATVTGGITSTVGGGITPGVAGGIQCNIANGLVSTVAGGVASVIAGGIRSNVAGGITMSGGSSDYVTYTTTRTKTMVVRFGLRDPLGSGWSLSGGLNDYLLGPATGAPTSSTLNDYLLDGLRNGAQLTSVKIRLQVTGPHSGVPSVPPNINISRVATAPGGAPVSQSLFSTGTQSFWPATGLGGMAMPGSGNAWDAGSAIQEVAWNPDQNQTIDLSTYRYVLTLIDENGAASVSGNGYLEVVLVQTQIANGAH